MNFLTVSGVAATRVSAGLVSAGMAISMIDSTGTWFNPDRCYRPGQAGCNEDAGPASAEEEGQEGENNGHARKGVLHEPEEHPVSSLVLGVIHGGIYPACFAFAHFVLLPIRFHCPSFRNDFCCAQEGKAAQPPILCPAALLEKCLWNHLRSAAFRRRPLPGSSAVERARAEMEGVLLPARPPAACRAPPPRIRPSSHEKGRGN